MAFRGFPRRLQRNGGWLERVAIGTAGTAPVFPPLYIKPTAAPSGAKQAGDLYYDSTANQIMVYNGTRYTMGSGSDYLVSVQIPTATTAIDQNIFTAGIAYQVRLVRGVFSVTNGAAFTMDVKKCTGTQAPSAGTTVLTAAQDWNTTANTVITSTLSATPANLLLAAGDRLAIDFTGSATSIAGGNVVVFLKPL